MSALIVGCGDLGTRVAQQLRARGAAVRAVLRSESRAAALAAAGVSSSLLDLDALPATLPVDRLAAPDCLFHFAPPPARGREDVRSRALLAALPADWRPGRAVLVSTSGVYGDCAGEWVDESRPPAPLAERAFRRLDAEQVWQQWCNARGVPLVILRVPGIYGPERLPRARIESGEPLLAEADSPWSNRIHIDDLTQIALAAGERGEGIYNASDDAPSTMTDYFNQVADALGLPRPAQISRVEAQQQLSPGMLSYLAESKRLCNRRLRESLGVELRYPTLADGLAALMVD